QHATDGSAARLAFPHLDMAAHDGVNRHTFDLPTVPWGRLVLAMHFVDVDGAFLVHIDNRDIAVGSETDRALLWIDLPHPRRILAGNLDVLIHCQSSFINLRQNQRNAGLDAAKARDAVPYRRLR